MPRGIWLVPTFKLICSPDGFVAMVTGTLAATKFAVTFRGPFMVSDWELEVPERSPLQFEN